MRNPVLTPTEMFDIIVRERGWMFNPGGGAAIWDEREGGAAAGGRLAGYAVFALIQVVDRHRNSVALARGEHLRYGDRHAEEKAVSALKKTIPQGTELDGGTMTVVVDQVPCPPERKDCLGLVQEYARLQRLNLEIWLPTRQRARGPGTVTPRTATRTSMRTNLPGWSLERFL